MVKEAFAIHPLSPGDVARALAFYDDYGPVDVNFLKSGMESGTIQTVMAVMDGRDIGAFYLNWQPKYGLYRRLNIPEMQDLRVHESARGQGVGTALTHEAEAMAAARATGLGISVGLHAGFGAAQRLYAKLGYIPDGQGVTYDRAPVAMGEKRPVDADLCLMLLKFF